MVCYILWLACLMLMWKLKLTLLPETEHTFVYMLSLMHALCRSLAGGADLPFGVGHSPENSTYVYFKDIILPASDEVRKLQSRLRLPSSIPSSVASMHVARWKQEYFAVSCPAWHGGLRRAVHRPSIADANIGVPPALALQNETGKDHVLAAQNGPLLGKRWHVVSVAMENTTMLSSRFEPLVPLGAAE